MDRLWLVHRSDLCPIDEPVSRDAENGFRFWYRTGNLSKATYEVVFLR